MTVSGYRRISGSDSAVSVFTVSVHAKNFMECVGRAGGSRRGSSFWLRGWLSYELS